MTPVQMSCEIRASAELEEHISPIAWGFPLAASLHIFFYLGSSSQIFLSLLIPLTKDLKNPFLFLNFLFLYTEVRAIAKAQHYFRHGTKIQ